MPPVQVTCPKCGAHNAPWSEEIRGEVESKAAGKEWHGMIFCKKCGETIKVDPFEE